MGKGWNESAGEGAGPGRSLDRDLSKHLAMRRKDLPDNPSMTGINVSDAHRPGQPDRALTGPFADERPCPRRIPLWIAMAGAVFLMVGSAPSQAAPGLADNGRLAVCPGPGNCVCSEHPDQDAVIAPLAYHGEPEDAWQTVRDAVLETGGHIVDLTDLYLHATYTSRLFRFVDDLELRLDRQTGVIHVRSASRVGRSDFGVNRKRVERLRQAFSDRLPTG